MNSIADELIQNCDAIAQRWCQAWHETESLHQDLSEAAAKDKLALQLRIIGEQLKQQRYAKTPEETWHLAGPPSSEERVDQNALTDKVVQEYWLAVSTVREWVTEKDIDVDFGEYSYFYQTIYELVAESIRRYSAHCAEQTRRDRSHYLASVMHQLRTPLSALSLQVEVLNMPGQDIDRATVNRLQRNIRRISVLVDGILRLERFRPSEVVIHPQKLHLGQLVADIMNDYWIEATRAGLQFEAHVDNSLSIITDPDLFIDALGNLVQNAVKYVKKGYVIIDTEADAQDILLRVRDSGPGISPEKQHNLLKCVQPGSEGGAGLGLQIAQHAAQALGGKIEMESEFGKGSVFSLRIPKSVRQTLPYSEAR